MSSVNSLGTMFTDQTSTQTASGSNSSSLQEIGQSEFLKLLVTQLQNQDPMNPVSNEDFIAQLATFSSLDQLISINQGVTKLADSIAGTGSTSVSGSESTA
jgi:flagellar basal-body rod modification protein FlgD